MAEGGRYFSLQCTQSDLKHSFSTIFQYQIVFNHVLHRNSWPPIRSLDGLGMSPLLLGLLQFFQLWMFLSQSCWWLFLRCFCMAWIVGVPSIVAVYLFPASPSCWCLVLLSCFKLTRLVGFLHVYHVLVLLKINIHLLSLQKNIESFFNIFSDFLE